MILAITAVPFASALVLGPATPRGAITTPRAFPSRMISPLPPKGFLPNPFVVKKAREIYKNDDLLKIIHDPCAAVNGANVLYTDVWSSMGEENQKEQKDKSFQGFTIDTDLVNKADKNAIILHCLPAYRSKEITDEVIESKRSRVFEQAENRMHVQQSILACLLA